MAELVTLPQCGNCGSTNWGRRVEAGIVYEYVLQDGRWVLADDGKLHGDEVVFGCLDCFDEDLSDQALTMLDNLPVG